MNLYRESLDAGNRYRETMLAEVKKLVCVEQRKAKQRRNRFFRPDLSSLDAYEQSTVPYREALTGLLGWPLTKGGSADAPVASFQDVATDSLGQISRVFIETLPGVQTYGLFFRPEGEGPFPLVLALHGGGGTPEVCSGFFGSGNYNDMTRRVLKRGFAVFAPQLLLWNSASFGPDNEKDLIDQQLKQVGGSLAALELYRLRRSLDYFVTRQDIDAERIGMIGLSYGGFYTLFAAALDERIRAAVSSGYFSNCKKCRYIDWVWFDVLNRLDDAEVGALVCPRSLHIEVGRQDKLFDFRHVRPEVRKLEAVYARLGIGERFGYREHGGGHELDTSDTGINFLCRHLGK